MFVNCFFLFASSNYDETFEDCCIRGIEEETGYIAEIIEKIKVKK
ncbi:NUDIX domain-containing protein [Metabacillus niabensis]